MHFSLSLSSSFDNLTSRNRLKVAEQFYVSDLQRIPHENRAHIMDSKCTKHVPGIICNYQ